MTAGDTPKDRPAIAAALWSHPTIGLVLTDGMTVLDANEASAHLLDRPVAALIGSPVTGLLTALGLPGQAAPQADDTLLGIAVHDQHEPIDIRWSLLEDGRWLLTATPLGGRQQRGRMVGMDEVVRIALQESIYGYDVVDANGRFLYANRAYLRMWGFDSLDQIVGTSPASHCLDPTMPEQIIGTVLDAGQGTFEFVAQRRDGSTFDVLMSVQTARLLDGSPVFFGTSLDISEQKRLQRDLLQLQKVEAIGQIAAGLAHDLNNLLVPILGYTDLIMNQGNLNARHRHYLEQINLAALSSRSLTSQLLSFSREQLTEIQAVDLNQAILDLRGIITVSLRENIDCTITTDPAPTWIAADVSQIHQVILNLTNNARDALPNGGHLRITTLNAAAGRQRINDRPAHALIIADDGCGMSDELRQRVFDPFFTTKGKRGTGLGLTSVRSIIEEHGGEITIESAPDRGTRFTILLPATPAPQAAATAAADVRPRGQGHHVLVVEDCDAIREFVAIILAEHGFEVSVCASVAAAIARLDEHPSRYDLLLTDVVLGDGSCRDITAHLAAQQREIDTVYMSGHASEVIDPHKAADQELTERLLRKPFLPHDLLDMLARCGVC